MKEVIDLFKLSGTGKLRLIRSAVLLAASTLALGYGTGAHAIPIDFEISDVDVQIVNVTGNCGFIGQVSGACTPVVNTAAPISYTLNGVGDTDTSGIFDITVGGLGTGSGTATVETILTFSAPTSASSGVISGTGSFLSTFTFAGFLGLGSFFTETVSVAYAAAPSIVAFNDGTEISLALNGGSSTCTGLALAGGCQVNIGVSGTSTLNVVPEPGTLALLGAGLLGLSIKRKSNGQKFLG